MSPEYRLEDLRERRGIFMGGGMEAKKNRERGPDFWGLLNPDWNLCSKGRRQSPVDLNPNTLLFDPHLKPLHVDKSRDAIDPTQLYQKMEPVTSS
ncbi:hypothetical protein HPB51_002401 [Rhipicephalus microplus]|uniref:Alpha-carbonic anhydrase domain-containing protein n=1 Tax=Rhipicephalus microplus TaxID=6941 RepID=A0A9J6DS97_RHIMP|nr:hypothetical protein HPB51_002401 [Rhipicephalus microplus]